jgi:molybdenum cofactor biosynthesis enzyme MoaA
MTLDQIKRVLELTAKHGQHTMLGGGEFTLHPEFEKILAMIVSICPPKDGQPLIGIITNGSMTDRALMLNDMGAKKLINASLSYDQFHDPIDPKVFNAFNDRQNKSKLSDPNQFVSDSGWC